MLCPQEAPTPSGPLKIRKKSGVTAHTAWPRCIPSSTAGQPPCLLSSASPNTRTPGLPGFLLTTPLRPPVPQPLPHQGHPMHVRSGPCQSWLFRGPPSPRPLEPRAHRLPGHGQADSGETPAGGLRQTALFPQAMGCCGFPFSLLFRN